MATERGPVVVDTDVHSARLIPASAFARQYEPLLVRRAEFASFQTVAEVRYGALLRGWGGGRLGRMDATFGRIEIVYPGPDLIRTYAELRVACQRAGHPLSQREHDADRWIAATAIRLGIPLISNDGVFATTHPASSSRPPGTDHPSSVLVHLAGYAHSGTSGTADAASGTRWPSGSPWPPVAPWVRCLRWTRRGAPRRSAGRRPGRPS